jgi:ATP-dependent DNA ligase
LQTVADAEDGKLTMLTRRGVDWTTRFTPIAAAAGRLKAKTAYLDGEGGAALISRRPSKFPPRRDALCRG